VPLLLDLVVEVIEDQPLTPRADLVGDGDGSAHGAPAYASVQNPSKPTGCSTAARPRRSRASSKLMSMTTATSIDASGVPVHCRTSSTVSGAGRRSRPGTRLAVMTS